MPDHPRLRVGVLRHTVFGASERFIPDQVRATPNVVATIISRDAVVDQPPGVRATRMAVRGRADTARYVLTGWDAPLRSTIREEGIELLHAHFGVEGMYSRRAAERLDIPHLVTLHGFDVSYTRRALLASRTPSWIRYAALRRRLLESGSLFVCVSEHVRRLALALGAREDRTTVLTTGVDTAQLTTSGVTKAPRIVHVARLVEKKGTTDLIEALRVVRAAVPDVRLDIIGDGPLRPQLEAQAAAAGLDGQVRFRGVRTHAEVLTAIREARVVAVPSVTAASGDTEGLPQAVLEAGALGRAVVATRHAGIGEAVTDGDTGLLVGERQPAALADALTVALVEPNVAERLGAAARARVEVDFDVTCQATRLRQIYAGLVTSGPTV